MQMIFFDFKKYSTVIYNIYSPIKNHIFYYFNGKEIFLQKRLNVLSHLGLILNDKINFQHAIRRPITDLIE